MIGRHLAEKLKEALTISRIVNIVGPRQAGKTTLVRKFIDAAYYITFDDDSLRETFLADPYGQLQLLTKEIGQIKSAAIRRPIVLDEVQRLPEITLALKRIVDNEQRFGQFVLTGSSDIFSTSKTYDSLAGRVMSLTLRPLSLAEIAGAAPCRLLECVSQYPEDCRQTLPIPVSFTREDAIDLILRGGFPEIRILDERNRQDRYQSYLDSVVERDVAAIADIRKPDVLRRFIDQLAARISEELNISTLSKLLGIRKETITNYLDVLSRLGLIYRVGAWTSSTARREIKAPKLHVMDTGLSTVLRGEDCSSFGIGADLSPLGRLVENLVFIELKKSLPFQSKRWRLYHWREAQREIDILAEGPGKLLVLIEIKAALTVTARDFRHID